MGELVGVGLFDAYREDYLRERGWRVLKNWEAFENARRVEAAIWKVLEPEG
jgi:hypothetical protein